MSLIRKVQIYSSDDAKLVNVDVANAARTTATVVATVQNVDATGKVAPSGDTVENAPFVKLTDGTNTATVDAANTARTTATKVVAVQNVDVTGKVSPAGDVVGNAPFVKLTDGTNTATVDAVNTARTTATKVVAVQNIDSTGKVAPSGDALTNAPYGQMAGLVNDTDLRVPRIDLSTHTLQNIDYEHHEIHSGSHFFYTDSVEIDSAGTQVYLITTPNTTKWAHIKLNITGSAITQADMYEGADRTGTTLQTAFNNDRNSATTPTTTIHKDVSSGTTDGTLIYKIKSGSSSVQSRSPMLAERNSEIILKQNTKYLVRITSGTNDNLTNLQLEWYEHTNKT